MVTDAESKMALLVLEWKQRENDLVKKRKVLNEKYQSLFKEVIKPAVVKIISPLRKAFAFGTSVFFKCSKASDLKIEIRIAFYEYRAKKTGSLIARFGINYETEKLFIKTENLGTKNLITLDENEFTFELIEDILTAEVRHFLFNAPIKGEGELEQKDFELDNDEDIAVQSD